MTSLYAIPHAFWSYLLESAPWLLVGFAVAGAMHALVPQSVMQRWLGAGRKWAVVRASAIGIPLPLCSCSVIPTAAALHAGGASRGSAAAFAISTPEVDAPSIALTWGMIGPWVAVARPIAALATALGVGWLIDRYAPALPAQTSTQHAATPAPTQSCCSEPAPASSCCSELAPESSCCSETTSSCCCDTKEDPQGTTLIQSFRAGARFALITLPRSLALWILFGLALSAVVASLVPPDLFTQIASVDRTGMLTKLAALIIGIPWYVCATASTPLAAALIATGLSPGAALVFLLAGPATNPATMGWVLKDLGARALGIYIAGIAIGAMLAGVILDLVIPEGALNMIDAASQHHHESPARLVMAIILLAILGVGATSATIAHVKRFAAKRNASEESCCH